MAPSEVMIAVPSPSNPLCRGIHCLDRDACFEFDSISKVTRLSHDSDDCDVHPATEELTLRYINRTGATTRISVDEAQELMQCTYTSKLLFQSSHMLRNYGFWGFTGQTEEGFVPIPMEPNAWSIISPNVAIGHTSMLDLVSEDEDNGLGLFSTASLPSGAFLGEYTGMVQVNADTVTDHDAYGVCYPSVFERGELRVSATEYGNEMRCINHSDQPNACFTPMIRRGILHIYCFTTRPVATHEQIFVNYGMSYWKGAGVQPVLC